MTAVGWNQHGYWVGPAEDEPAQGRPRRARCGGPKLCGVCGPTIVTSPPRADGMKVAPCSFCHEPIIWAQTQPNPRARTAAKRAEVKLVPFDSEPDSHGKWALTPASDGGRPTCGEMPYGMAAGWRAAGKPTFQRHVKTCPQVSKWPKGEYLVKLREKGKQ